MSGLDPMAKILGFAALIFVLILCDWQSPLSAEAQTSEKETTISLQGSVRDTAGQAVSGAKVSLVATDRAQPLTTQTDEQGTFRFFALSIGIYTLRVEAKGFLNATFGPYDLSSGDEKKIDLTVSTPKDSGTQDSSAQHSGAEGADAKNGNTVPQFFDEPQFTVAGVTDPTNLGGHGSDTMLRTKESLAKETASLKNEPALIVQPPIAQPDSQTVSATTEASLRERAKQQPEDFAAQYAAGKFLLEHEQPAEALAYLERASQLAPRNYEANYELAVACDAAGEYDHARANIQLLLAQGDKAELHHLLANVEEGLGDSLDAVREYQHAAEMDPREQYFFDWGTELLVHRATEPAIEVFARGRQLFPRSVRMLIGLAVAWYARGSWERAAHFLCEASDLDPHDTNSYLIMGKLQSVDTTHSDIFVERLARFSKLYPENALAEYYYAVCLTKQRKSPGDTANVNRVRSLLEEAVRLDPKLGPAYLQLGILDAENGNLLKAIAEYQSAAKATPDLEEAHYRLAQAYRQSGEKQKAQEELQLYEQLSKKRTDEMERERHEIPQFVYTLRAQPSP